MYLIHFVLHIFNFAVLLLLLASECGAQSATTTNKNDWAYIANTVGRAPATPQGLPPRLSDFLQGSPLPFPTLPATSPPAPPPENPTVTETVTFANITLVNDGNQTNATNQTLEIPARQLFNITTAQPLCGYSREMASGRPPYTAEEANLLISRYWDSSAMIRNATSQAEFPWLAVIASSIENIPLHCYGVIIDESHVLTTKSCHKLVTTFKEKTIVVRLGLFIGHQANPNDTSVKSYYLNASTDVLIDPSANLTLLTLNDRLRFRTPRIRPICIAQSRAKCHSACKGGLFSVAIGVPASVSLFTLSKPVRAFMLLPNETDDAYEKVDYGEDLNQMFDGASFATIRKGRLHLCGLQDGADRYIPICNFYDWLVGPDPVPETLPVSESSTPMVRRVALRINKHP